MCGILDCLAMNVCASIFLLVCCPSFATSLYYDRKFEITRNRKSHWNLEHTKYTLTLTLTHIINKCTAWIFHTVENTRISNISLLVHVVWIAGFALCTLYNVHTYPCECVCIYAYNQNELIEIWAKWISRNKSCNMRNSSCFLAR